MTKLTCSLIACVLFLLACQGKRETNEHDHGANNPPLAEAADTLKKSIPKEEHATVGAAHIMIKYHAPAVRGRTIWGGLVPYGEVWVTGAHNATSLETNKDVSIAGQDIPAGKYALFTIPEKDKWTIILNRNWDQHLADEYDPKEDVLRMDVMPETEMNLQERLKYTIIPDGEARGVIAVRWEKVKVSIPFQVK